MGLSLKVGPVEDDVLRSINDVLRGEQLPRLEQPVSYTADAVYDVDMYGYQGVHYLRRIAAHLGTGTGLPHPGGPNASDDPVLKAAYEDLVDRYTPPTRFGHLIQHGDSDGYYVPIAFPQVLRAPAPLGGLIGSAVVLLAECALLATAIALPLDTDPFSDEVDAATAGLADPTVLWHSYGIESLSCLLLFNAAKNSIASGYPLRFW